ncbi:DUF5304 domain-containing protein [Streptomyces sp. NPDC055186]
MSDQLPPPDAAGDEPVDDVRAVADDVRAVDEARTAFDTDAWATACAEDLEAEKVRRRARYGPPPGSAAEELRKLVDAVAEKFDQLTGGLPAPLFGAVAGPAAQQVVRQVVQQAKAAVEPVVERNPDVFDHLAAAGNELLAAYRSAVQGQERRWTTGETRAWNPDEVRDEGGEDGPGRDRGDEPGPGGERIDLD